MCRSSARHTFKIFCEGEDLGTKVLSVRTLCSFSFNLHLLEYGHSYTNTLFWGLPSFRKFLMNNFRFAISDKSAVITRQFSAPG